MNRGSVARSWPEGADIFASMRPRFMNRGSSPSRLAQVQHYAASMRPRFMNRGSAHETAGQGESATRFNEAPIHESGKWR